MQARALRFGSVAADYERHRLGYPEEIADLVLAFAGRPVTTALEVGAGTGKATRLFARRGLQVTATDPDEAMLAELRRHVPSSVVTVHAAFEDLPRSVPYDLVFAAAAMHWTAPAGRWDRVARLLLPGGVFASFGGPVELADPALELAVGAAQAPFLTDDDVPSPDGTPPSSIQQWPGPELTRSEHFVDVSQTTIERRLRVSSRDYVAHLSTVSAYLELPDRDRREVLKRIHAVVPDEVDLVADLTLHLARRVGSAERPTAGLHERPGDEGAAPTT